MLRDVINSSEIIYKIALKIEKTKCDNTQKPLIVISHIETKRNSQCYVPVLHSVNNYKHKSFWSNQTVNSRMFYNMVINQTCRQICGLVLT